MLADITFVRIAGSFVFLTPTHHLNTEAGQAEANNLRNGSSRKPVITPAGELDLNISHALLATFEAQLVARHQRRLPGFDDHVIACTRAA